MAGEQLSKAGRDEVFRDMVGIMIHRAVAEGAVGMMQVTKPGTPQHEQWTRVAGRAVPLARDFIEDAGRRYEARHSGEYSTAEAGAESAEPALSKEERQLKQDRLAEIEEEASRLRKELEQ